MSEINITALRQDLPAYVARARRGERIQVTSRGKVVAVLGPPIPSQDETARARERLHGSVRRYERPLEPVIDPREWESGS
ncbi:MAG: type II toxin-antitoxin system prevent-host-death family antitoxin [Burkholderiales bacterium]|nr:type II toxin-antitoxin system prevent-host-death family antitoxin [Burkholderiales bacterium]